MSIPSAARAPQNRTVHRTAAGGALVALLVALLAGCSASGATATAESAARPATADGSAAASGHVAFQSGTGRAPIDRSITTTGTLELTAKRPIDAATDIAAIVEGSGGRMQTVDKNPKGAASAHLVARIPSAVFATTLRSIERHGTVTDVTQTATDVTQQVTDYVVRIAGLRTSITRLQTLLAKAGTTTDLVAIESSLTSRETDLEQLLADQQGLADQVSYSTLTITVTTPAALRPSAAPTTFLSGLATGSAGLVATAGAIVVVFGVLLPWLAAIGAFSGVATAIIRFVRRRRHQPAAPA